MRIDKMCSMSSKHIRDRRTFLKRTGVVGTALLAGCSGGGNSNGGSSNASDGGTGGSGTTGGTSSGSSSSSSGGSGSAKNGGMLNYAQTSSPVALDPINNKGGNYSLAIKNWVYSPLFTYDRQTNLVPMLATEIPELTNDGKQFTLKIDQRAKFHDGSDVTADDVQYTLTQPVKESTSWAGDFEIIDTIDVKDKHTLDITLKEPYKPIFQALAFSVVPKAVREKDPGNFGTKTIVGSGPFKVSEFAENDHVTLEAWDGWWGDGKPHLGGVKFTPINESVTRVTNLKNGSMDIINRIPPKLWTTVKGMNDAGIVEGPGLNYQFAAFNQKAGECSKLKVRQAIAHCVDLDSAVKKYIEPTGERMYTPIPATVAKAWDMPLDKWKGMWPGKDLDKAKQLFEEANVPKDWTCKILVSSTQKRKQMAVSIANGIKAAGYDAQVQYIDFSQMLEVYNSGDPKKLNMFLLGWSGAPDPDRFMYRLLYIHGSFQGQYFTNEKFNNLLQQAHTETDHDKRRQAYIQAITIFINQVVHLPLYYTKTTMGVKNSVKGLKPQPVSTHNPFVFGQRMTTNGDVKADSATNVWLDK